MGLGVYRHSYALNRPLVARLAVGSVFGFLSWPSREATRCNYKLISPIRTSVLLLPTLLVGAVCKPFDPVRTSKINDKVAASSET